MHLKTKVAVVSAFTLAVTARVVWQENAIARARAHIRDRAAILEQLRFPPDVGTVLRQAGAEGIPDERADLERLRAEVKVLRARLDQERAARLATAAAVKDGNVQGVRRPGFHSFRDARDVGAATPEALFQTMFWAIANGATNRIVELSDWASDEARQQMGVMAYEMAEAAAEAGRNGVPDVAIRVVRQVPLPDGDTAVVIEIAHENSLDRQAVRARLAGAEWRLVLDKSGPQQLDLGEDLNRE